MPVNNRGIQVSEQYVSPEDKTSFGSGVKSLAANIKGAGALGSRLLGFEKTAGQLQAEADRDAARAAALRPDVKTFTEGEGVGDFAETATDLALSQAPQIALSVAGGLGGLAVRGGIKAAAMLASKKILQKNIGKATAATAGATLPSGAQITGETISQIRQEAPDVDTRTQDLTALAAAIPQTAMESLAIGTPVAKLFKGAKGVSRARKAAEVGLTGAVTEGVTEPVQGQIQDTATHLLNPKFEQFDLDARINEMIGGALIGGGMGGLGGALAPQLQAAPAEPATDLDAEITRLEGEDAIEVFESGFLGSRDDPEVDAAMDIAERVFTGEATIEEVDAFKTTPEREKLLIDAYENEAQRIEMEEGAAGAGQVRTVDQAETIDVEDRQFLDEGSTLQEVEAETNKATLGTVKKNRTFRSRRDADKRATGLSTTDNKFATASLYELAEDLAARTTHSPDVIAGALAERTRDAMTPKERTSLANKFGDDMLRASKEGLFRIRKDVVPPALRSEDVLALSPEDVEGAITEDVQLKAMEIAKDRGQAAADRFVAASKEPLFPGIPRDKRLPVGNLEAVRNGTETQFNARQLINKMFDKEGRTNAIPLQKDIARKFFAGLNSLKAIEPNAVIKLKPSQVIWKDAARSLTVKDLMAAENVPFSELRKEANVDFDPTGLEAVAEGVAETELMVEAEVAKEAGHKKALEDTPAKQADDMIAKLKADLQQATFKAEKKGLTERQKEAAQGKRSRIQGELSALETAAETNDEGLIEEAVEAQREVATERGEAYRAAQRPDPNSAEARAERVVAYQASIRKTKPVAKAPKQELPLKKHPFVRVEDDATAQQHEQIARKWLDKLGIKLGDKVTIMTAEQGRADAKRRGEDLRKYKPRGFVSHNKTKGTYQIFVAQMKPELMLETLAHELGHIVQLELLNGDTAMLKALQAEHHKAITSKYNGDSYIGDLLRNRVAHNTFESLNIPPKKTLNQFFGKDKAQYHLSFNEWFADQTARWLTTDAKPQSDIELLFEGIANLLKRLFRMAGIAKPNQAVADYLRTQYRSEPVTAPEVEVLADVEGPPDEVLAASHNEDVYSDATRQALQNSLQDGGLLTKGELNIVENAVQSGPVRRQLAKLMEGTVRGNDLATSKKALDNPNEAIAYAYQFWMAGELKLGTKVETIFQKILKAIRKTLGVVTNEDNTQEIFDRFSKGQMAAREAGSLNWEITSRLSDTRTQRSFKAIEEMSKPMLDLYSRSLSTAAEQVDRIGNAQLTALRRQVATRVGSSEQGEDMISARNARLGEFIDEIHNIVGKTGLADDPAFGKRLADVLNKVTEAETKEEREAAAGIRSLLTRIFRYTRGAGVGIKYTADYFPRVMDTSKLEGGKQKFIDMLLQDKYKDELAKFGDDPKAAAESIYTAYMQNYGDSETASDELAREFEEGPGNEIVGAPRANAVHERSLGWIKDEDIGEFLSDEIGLTLSKYIHQMTKRAEFVRRFGVDKEGKAKAGRRSFEAYLDAARKTGATEDETEVATNFMKATMGTLSVDKLNPKFQKLQGWVLVVQNYAVLGLATVTSLVDPIGIAVRGDLDTAWVAMQAGLGEVISQLKQEEKSDRTAFGEMIGALERDTTMAALGFEYGGYHVTGMARKANHLLFKMNGLEGWTKWTRTIGVTAATHFIRKHTFREGKNSKRFMSELGLKEGDVTDQGDLGVLTNPQRASYFDEEAKLRSEVSKEADARKERRMKGIQERIRKDNRVRAAINRFTDEAILRPDASQRPIWGSDPRFMLLMHLKSFTFSFQERILRRVFSEVLQGNYAPLMTMAAYAPAALMTIILRDMIDGGEDEGTEEPLTSGMVAGAERGGLFGVMQFVIDGMQDVQRGGTGFERFAGPTISHTHQLAKALWSEGWEDDAQAVSRGMPGHVIWNGWFE